MNDVTADASEKPAPADTETGWAQTRRRGDRGVRTCLPAVVDRTRTERRGDLPEDHIVRGED